MPSLFPNDGPAGFARIAVERGIDRYPDGLTYGIPAELADLEPGERVVVPLGRGDRPSAGYVVEIDVASDLEPDAVKLIQRRDDGAVRLPAGLLALARWIASYYCAPIGMTLAAMLPAAVKKGVGAVSRTLIDLPDETGEPPEDAPKITPKQRAVLDTLWGLDDAARPIEIRVLAEQAGLKTVGPIRRLVEHGRLRSMNRTTVEAAWSQHAVDTRAPESLTTDQRRVVDAIGETLGGGFSAHLVSGVTGSGKTEVYIRLIERVVAAGRVAVMLVPEISLTPQTGGRLIGRFPDHRVAILHSGLTAAQRHQQWLMAADGRAHIVLGARSAVFAPVETKDLGLLIVDEEHDGSYKQDQAPRYHGRDVAVRRAQLAGCPIVLGSATPSLESWFNATDRGLYRLHRLPERVAGMRLPVVRVVDLAAERRARPDRRVHLLGPVLEQALGRALDGGGQALLLLNRRGYANYIACPDQVCGWVMNCLHCDVTMVYHKSSRLPAGGFVQCHHCLSEQQLPPTCPDCGRRVTTFGLGTQRVEEELIRKFPPLAVDGALARVDSDTMRSARDFHDVLDRFGAGRVRVMVGTQMIAKGLDFPGVRLVGVVNADTAINLPDFRATERTFQLVSQVAGRSGRTANPDGMGLVIVQSFNPETPAIELAAAHDYETFATREIDERRACGLPPITRLARIVVRDEDHARCVEAARLVADGLRAIAGSTIRVRGPAPCPIARIAGRHRQQVEILAPTAAELQRVVTDARNRQIVRPGTGMAVDVDPVALL
ncbi:MAG: primosomal protein N' [Planctomycetes bacterium]|nr:primosomal protein N' [Planctomycetota bacterium]